MNTNYRIHHYTNEYLIITHLPYDEYNGYKMKKENKDLELHQSEL